MPFGLCNASATFQRCMLAIFHDMIEESVEVFMDDFFVMGNSFDTCLNNLDKMLQRCKEAHLVLNWEKCHFMVQEGIVLGHKVSSARLEVDKANFRPPHLLWLLILMQIGLGAPLHVDYLRCQLNSRAEFELQGCISPPVSSVDMHSALSDLVIGGKLLNLEGSPSAQLAVTLAKVYEQINLEEFTFVLLKFQFMLLRLKNEDLVKSKSLKLGCTFDTSFARSSNLIVLEASSFSTCLAMKLTPFHVIG
ncbi:reverse transcriptase domain-containing protein [Tanacetum coccineum]